jgi:hypothetical protein
MRCNTRDRQVQAVAEVADIANFEIGMAVVQVASDVVEIEGSVIVAATPYQEDLASEKGMVGRLGRELGWMEVMIRRRR